MKDTIYYVYHIFNINEENNLNKGYIGVTKNLESRFYGHCKSKYLIGRAIRKYKLTFKENLQIIATFDNKEEAYLKEISLRPKVKMGWNLGAGGFGGARIITEAHKKKLSDLNKGENNAYYGIKHNKQIRDKISKTLKNKSEVWRKETASKAGKANKGKIRTEENKKNYSVMANARPKYTCQHCNKTGQYNSMIAYHGDNCKLKRV